MNCFKIQNDNYSKMFVEKKYNYIYQTVNLQNGMIYIGRHSTNDLNDGYIGSGTKLQEDIEKYGRENFKKEILHIYDTWEEMVRKEIELLTEEFIAREDTYNISGQGSGLITHSDEVKQLLSQINKGIVTVKDENGNYFKVSVNDPRYLSGELKHNTHGTIAVKDSEGNRFRVDKNDPRWLSGELVGINSGAKQDQERIDNRVKKNIEWWKNNSHTEEGIKKMSDVNKGKANVRDKDGNVFRVPVDDERLLSGELVNDWKGRKHSDLTKNKIGNTKSQYIWICNIEINQSKQILKSELDDYLVIGWVKGRLPIDGIGEKIKNGRTPGRWMIDSKTSETRIIYLELVDEYIKNGWFIGRKLPNEYTKI